MNVIFLKLLNISITSSWLILAIILVRFLLKKAPKWIRCSFWALVAIRLICPFSFESTLSLIPSLETIPSNIEIMRKPAIDSGITVINEMVNPLMANSFASNSLTSTNSLQIVVHILSIIWIIGMIIMLFYAFTSYLKLKKNVEASIKVKDNIYACDEVKSPFILGIIKPLIYIPSSMKGETFDYVIAHEKAHIKRNDHLWKPFGYLLLSIYWFNPLCWIAYILLCRDIEMACDEKVICDLDREKIANYSQTLLDCSIPNKRIISCPLAFGEVGVKERVKSILNYKKPSFWIIVIALLSCIVIGVCFLTNPISNNNLSYKLNISMKVAIKEHNHSAYPNNYFVTNDYDVLSVSKDKNKTTVYAWVYYGEYSFDGSDIKIENQSHIPTVITFDTSTEKTSIYETIEYWTPRNGSNYKKDICSKFPITLWTKAFDTSNSEKQKENSLLAAQDKYLFLEPSDRLSIDVLRRKYPEFFDLETKNGLEIYVWQLAANSYRFGILPGINNQRETLELIFLKGASVEEMKVILSTYDIDSISIAIRPWQNPISSYIPEYLVPQGGGEASRQAYINKIASMLFENTIN